MRCSNLGVLKREPSYTVAGNVNWCSHYGEQYGGSLKTKYRTTIRSSNRTPGHIPGQTIILKHTCTPVFIAKLITIAKAWKQPKCPSRDEWIRKMWYIYTMEQYSAIKKNNLMPFAATWIELETLILSKISQKEKDKYHMISLICGI